MNIRKKTFAILGFLFVFFLSCSREENDVYYNSNNGTYSEDAYYVVTNSSGISGITFYIEEYNENDRILETYTRTGAFSKKYHANNNSVGVKVTDHMISGYTHNDIPCTVVVPH